MLYDDEALSPAGTAAALRHASRLGLAMYLGRGYWTATAYAGDLRAALEDRFLRETERPRESPLRE